MKRIEGQGEGVIGAMLATSSSTFSKVYIECTQSAKFTPSGRRDMECYASGWGRTSQTPFDHTIPEDLKFTLVTPLADSECKKKRYPKRYFDEAQMCTMGHGSNGVCNGDSGGPLTCHKTGSDPQLYGVASFVSGYEHIKDCLTEFPNYWADAASDHARGWISLACNGCV
ncbi:unnamed protein product [Cyprideis torosa]|uniref:Uncharacterized protein n=1 Tax=Cyprideis torosa TaxID=163714 RepID=A0A7R8WS76_9CRUS|nr:unnamed protein product [Cyprideis torosa]CAG0903453.1 unnamed protein product [Cyprideis torosa]